MKKKLQDKVAVVTGGNSGIGLATAQQLVSDGAHVFITGRRKPELDQAVELIGHGVTPFQGDVTKLADIDRLYALVKEKKGKIDILFANAGIGEMAKLGEITEEHFDKIYNINVKGVVFTVQKALPLIVDGASIILNASIVSCKGMEGFSVYSSTKAALRSFVRSWVLDLKSRKIRVNAVSPGPIETPAINNLTKTPQETEDLKKHLIAMVPLDRMGEPEEIAKVVSFLASDESSFINGIELFVDGGAAQI